MNVITVGRSSENNIVINDAKVSKTHLQLVQNDNGVCSVVDLNSTNGTFVNGQKITGEVRLQPYDVIRIGDTTLPWQEYIKPSMATGQKPMDNVGPAPKPKKTWWYVAACVVFILFAGSIGLYFYCNGKEKEKIEAAKRNQEELQKEELRQEAVQKAEEAKRLLDEADSLLLQALIYQNDESKALAEKKQNEAKEAKRKANAAIDALHNAESDKKAAEAAAEEANNRAAAAEQNSENAIKDAEDKAKQAISKANTERDSAKVKAKLTEKFYEEYAEKWFDNNSAKQVCQRLQYDFKDKNDARIALKDLFVASDNKGKQAIVDAMLVVKQRQNRKIKVKEPKVESDSLKTSNDKELTGDNIAVENDE